MPVISAPKCIRGSAIDFIMEVEGDDEGGADLDALPVASVANPRGTVVLTGQPTTKVAIGKYLYRHQSTAADLLGFFTVTFTGVIGGRTIIAVGRFEVVVQ